MHLLGSQGTDTIQDEKSIEWKEFSGARNLHFTSLNDNNIVWTNSK